MKTLSQRLAEANALLSPLAVPLEGTLGREHEEHPDATRFPFQRDRDRIIHTQAFRRLKGKTQVFVAHLRSSSYGGQAGQGELRAKADHYRTRLTHTMEVAQISRDMARTLCLNEDLAECIALTHDLGHTPFGHAGEEAMDEELQRHGLRFEHNEQSLRIVTLLENRTTHYPGLNLNREVLESLRKHRTMYDVTSGKPPGQPPSLESQIVNIADEIAYTAHDTDDGLRAEVFAMEELHSIPLFREAAALAAESGTEVRGNIIHLLVMDVYAETERRIEAEGTRLLADVHEARQDIVACSEEMSQKLAVLRSFLFERFYKHPDVLRHSQEGKRIVHNLFRAYEEHPPEKVLELQRKSGSSLPVAIKDYIAGMTDGFATEQAARLNAYPRRPPSKPAARRRSRQAAARRADRSAVRTRGPRSGGAARS